jgi:hypothetical protein
MAVKVKALWSQSIQSGLGGGNKEIAKAIVHTKIGRYQ